MKYYKCENCGAISAGYMKNCPSCHKPHKEISQTEYKTLLKLGGVLPEKLTTYIVIYPDNKVEFYNKLPLDEVEIGTACYEITDGFEISLLPGLIKRMAAKRIINSYLDGAELPENIRFIWYIPR